MAATTQHHLGTVSALWRYPVKSMLGEELIATSIGPRGVLGDRSYAIVDPETGKVASAKNPKKWPRLFDCHSAYVEAPDPSRELPAVRITLPDGRIVRSDDVDIDAALSSMLGRAGKLETAVPEAPVLEEYWPDIEGLSLREAVTDEALPAGTFFDLATVHLLATTTLDRFRELYPNGRFDVRRFRPNIVIETPPSDELFVENAWVERTIAFGDEVELRITGQCPRCVMTTLPQSDLSADPAVLRTVAQHNDAHVGVYADVVRGGNIRCGDQVGLI